MDFAELKRKRDEQSHAEAKAICQQYDWNYIYVADDNSCYCACPNGPCQHIWDGPRHSGDPGDCATCSLCGQLEITHDTLAYP